MITKTEIAEDYQFMCESLKSLSKVVGANDFNPTVLLADAAAAITNGCNAVLV